MSVAVVVHLRTDHASSAQLTGWVEEVATGRQVAVNGDEQLLAVLHRLVEETGEPPSTAWRSTSPGCPDP